MKITLKKQTKIGNLYINCSLKNTLITLTGFQNQIFFRSSCRAIDQVSKKKNNINNFKQISFLIRKEIVKNKLKILKIFVKGIGKGRYYILKSLKKKRKLKIYMVFDRTPIPFNGCRLKKQKRR